MNTTQADDLARLATDDAVVNAIARGLYVLFFTRSAGVHGHTLAREMERAAPEGVTPTTKYAAAHAYDPDYVRDVLRGRTDAEVWEREMGEGGCRIVSAEEYAVAEAERKRNHNRGPAEVRPPYSHAPAHWRRFDALRRAFVAAVAEDIAERRSVLAAVAA